MKIKIRMAAGEIKTVHGHRIRLPQYPDLNLAVHFDIMGMAWFVVTEISTGLLLGLNGTVKSAVKDALINIERNGVTRLNKTIEAFKFED